MVKGLVSKFKPEERQVCTINFNFFTNANLLQSTMEAPLEKKTGSNYGPVGQSRLVYFLDDLNLPEVDPYNTQSAIALIRQHTDYGHWFDMSKDEVSIKNIRRCQLLASMNNTAGSFEGELFFFFFLFFFSFFEGLPSLYRVVLFELF